MKYNRIIIIGLMLFALLLCIDAANATTITDNFANLNNWYTLGSPTVSNGELILRGANAPNGDRVESKTYFESTAQARPEKLATLARPLVEAGMAQELTGAGYLQAGTQCSALATSKGLFVYEKSTGAVCTYSARTSDGTGSGWVGGNQHDIDRLQTGSMAKTAVEKAFQSRNPTALEPGKYTVILEPSAVCDLMALMIGSFDARSADEGRSFFSKKGGGNKLGEKICGSQVNLYSDPHYELTPGSIYSSDGLPAIKRDWIKDGVVSELITPRFWAQKTGRAAVPYPTNLIMSGGTTSLQQMIENTSRGVLVTRFWYIREVDPRTLLFTGLTRDGTFLIEKGKISRPIKNFRFNESIVAMLNNIEAMGPSVRAIGSEIEDWSVCVPTLLVRDFTFSSVSEAV
jgi:predicted Zn-dependent protease